MTTSTNTIAGVYIIESLKIEDEGLPLEGEIISNILEMSKISTKYVYIQTKDELSYFIDDFVTSNYRFLHLSFHGSPESIWTTLDEIPHATLGAMFGGKLRYRRLFMSACSAVNNSLATNLFETSGCNSIIGPREDVNMDEIAIFWASFYHLMFKSNRSAMKKKDIVGTLDKLVKLYNIPFSYYRKSIKYPFFKLQNLL